MRLAIWTAMISIGLLTHAWGQVDTTAEQNQVALQATTLQHVGEALTQAEEHVHSLEREIADLQQQVQQLQKQIGTRVGPATGPDRTANPGAPTQAIESEQTQEDLALHQAEIETQEQTKVESTSRLPVRISGLILLNGFVNSRATDTPLAPSLVTSSSGAAGLSVQQTSLGLEVRGPAVLQARSHADVNVDFLGQPVAGSYGDSLGLLRLRTAHGTLDWGRTRVFVAQDRSLLSPYSPTSLTAVAVPALAWSGSLWNWVPQLGLSQDVPLREHHTLQMQAALLDVPDAPASPGTAGSAGLTASLAENSHVPGVTGRLALLTESGRRGISLGAGGYFSPHQIANGSRFDAWAASADLQWMLPAHFELTGNVYRGQALGGLGAGAYKDYVYRITPAGVGARALDDVGGWLQLKQQWSERLESNTAVGVDNAFAGEVRTIGRGTGYTGYQQLSRNRTLFANVIYAPSTYVLFSVEYRRILSSPAIGETVAGDVYGVSTGFRF